MKNSIKKITATISAALMCALPMANALTTNAASEKYKNYGANQKHTYRAYVKLDTKHKNVYEFDYDLYFDNRFEDEMTFKSGKCLVGADDYRIEGLTQNRTILRIESETLNNFDGDVATMVFDTDKWDLARRDIEQNISTGVYAFNNYREEHVIRQYYPNVETKIYLVGDADGNGVIMMNDAVTIEMNIGKTYNPVYDVDGNGVVNYYDSWLVRQFLLRSIDSFADYQA